MRTLATALLLMVLASCQKENERICYDLYKLECRIVSDHETFQYTYFESGDFRDAFADQASNKELEIMSSPADSFRILLTKPYCTNDTFRLYAYSAANDTVLIQMLYRDSVIDEYRPSENGLIRYNFTVPEPED